MRNLPQEDIRRLVSRAQNGEKNAFNELYRATSRAQYFTAITLLKDKILAEDAVQTTYLKVYQNLSTLSDPASFLSWLTSITYNNCMMMLRKRKRTDPELDTDISVEIPDPDAEECMLDTVIHQENHKFLLKLLDSLTPAHKTVILLRYYQGLKIKEIARITGATDGTVRSRIHYALKKLQKILNEKGFHGTESMMGTAAILTAASEASSLPAPMAASAAKSGRSTQAKVICAGCAAGLILSLSAWAFSVPKQKAMKDTEAPELKGYIEENGSCTLYLSDSQSGIDYGQLKAALSDGTPVEIRPAETKEVRNTSEDTRDTKKTGAVQVILPVNSPDQKSDNYIAVTAEDNAGNRKTWYIELNSAQSIPATHQ